MDTGSRERYQSLTAQYYNRANVIMLVCSLDSEHTLTCLTKWHAEAQYYTDTADIIYAVVATKSDLPETEREVTTELLHNFAGHLGVDLKCVFEVSSLTGEGIQEVISHICGEVIKLYDGSTRNEAGVCMCVCACVCTCVCCTVCACVRVHVCVVLVHANS